MVFLALPQFAQAATPNLSVTAQSGSNYQITVNSGNVHSSVDFYTRERGTDLWTVFHNLGQTDGNGNFSTSLLIGSFKASVVRESYVTVGGISSSAVSTGSGGQSASLTFSSSALSLNVGSSATVYVYGNSSQNLYVASNSNSSSASVSVLNAASLSVYGSSAGYASIQVCASGVSACGYFSVNVSGGNPSGSLSFSPASVSVNRGSSAVVTVYNNPVNQSLYIASNSNSSAVSAAPSGTNGIALYGISSGSASIQVCSGSGSHCGSFWVSVGGGSTAGDMTFSPANPSLTVGQNLAVLISVPYAYSGGYYISQNSNTGSVSASVSGNSLNLSGLANGNSALTVCQTGAGSACGTLHVYVSGGNLSGLSFNPSSLTLNLNANSSVYVSGGSGQNLYLYSNPNPSVASVGINNQNSITVYGVNAGSTTLRVCAVNSQVCGNLPVYVYSGSSNQGDLSFITANLPAGSAGSYYQTQLLVSGGNPPYTFQVTSGTLPPGLSLASGGLISGTPSNRSQYFFTIRATDYYGRLGSQAFSVEISGGGVLGSYVFQNGLIVQSGSTVYIVYKNTKSPFSSRGAFEGLGFRFSQISCTNCGYLPDSGHVVVTAAAPHPWGTWVKSGPTVYFVHADGLIPISSYDVFVNNGGQDYLVVPMNGYDANLQRLPVMTHNDSRLR